MREYSESFFLRTAGLSADSLYLVEPLSTRWQGFSFRLPNMKKARKHCVYGLLFFGGEDGI